MSKRWLEKVVVLSWVTSPETSPDVVHRTLPNGVVGYYSRKENRIYLDPALSQGQMTSTLAHEMIHAERGDYATGNELLDLKQEVAVEKEASRRLINIQELLHAARSCHSLEELAEDLVVDEEMLETRISMLTEDQARQLKTICGGWWSI